MLSLDKDMTGVCPHGFFLPILVTLIFIRSISGLGYIYGDMHTQVWLTWGGSIVYYALISILIWLERERLHSYHFDRLSVIMFLVFGSIFHTRMVGTGEIPVQVPGFDWLLCITIGFLLWIGLRKKSIILQESEMPGLFLILAGLGIGIVTAIVIMVLPNISKLAYSSLTWAQMFGVFITNLKIYLSQASIIEEPIYRGFLWGYWRSKGWREERIWVLQALLFALAHYNIGAYAFWVVAPVTGLIFGLCAWKFRSLFVPIWAHAAFNATSIVILVISNPNLLEIGK